jgi:prolyl 4-hydroxylase
LAANRGCGAAREQWLLIAGLLPSADRPARTGDVSLDAWLAPTAGRELHGAPRVFATEGLIAPEICAWLIRCSRPRLQPAQVFESSSGQVTRSELRTNMVARFGLLDATLLHILIQAKIAAAAGVALDHLEAFSVLNYAVGEEAREHADYIDPAAAGAAAQIARLGQRVATALVYLNDDYTGGETAFPALDIAHRGKTGDALVFRGTDADSMPDPRSIHAGRAPLSGEKWVLSQFIRDRRMIPG